MDFFSVLSMIGGLALFLKKILKEKIMDFFSVLSMIGGLALFLYGMHVMGDGLSKVSGGKMEKILESLTSNPLKAVGLGALVTAVIQSSSATMHVMGDGLSKVSGGKMEKILESLTSNPLKAVGLGALVTAVIQSSSATTVMVVGFVNSGIMKLSQAVGVIMGANIGTTITSWILSLSGIQSDSFFIKMFKPTSFSPILAIIGVAFLLFAKSEKKKDIGTIFLGFAVLMFGMESMSSAVKPLADVLAIIGVAFLLFAKSEKKKDIGTIFLGFAVLMFGMESMSSAVKPLADVPEFTGILTAFSNPLLGMLAGAVLTAVIQSSSASVGILQALCVTGAVSYSVAIPIILGQNIGTCVTALLSAIGAKKNQWVFFRHFV